MHAILFSSDVIYSLFIHKIPYTFKIYLIMDQVERMDISIVLLNKTVTDFRFYRKCFLYNYKCWNFCSCETHWGRKKKTRMGMIGLVLYLLRGFAIWMKMYLFEHYLLSACHAWMHLGAKLKKTKRGTKQDLYV